tara:strand:+ start:6313 stop:6741 length:429 start_codon:yes stop_codon:yes gene_type:complete
MKNIKNITRLLLLTLLIVLSSCSPEPLEDEEIVWLEQKNIKLTFINCFRGTTATIIVNPHSNVNKVNLPFIMLDCVANQINPPRVVYNITGEVLEYNIVEFATDANNLSFDRESFFRYLNNTNSFYEEINIIGSLTTTSIDK